MKIWFRVSAFISHLCGLLGIYIVNFIRRWCDCTFRRIPSCSRGHTPFGWLYRDRLLSGWRWFDVASIDMSLSKLWELVMDSGMLQFMGLQRVRHNWATVLNWTDVAFSPSQGSLSYLCLPSCCFFFITPPFVFPWLELSPSRLSGWWWMLLDQGCLGHGRQGWVPTKPLSLAPLTGPAASWRHSL